MGLPIYIFNKNFECVNIIEQYQSFIWTDKYCGPGDFELYSFYFDGWEKIFIPGYYIKIENSGNSYMIIEDIKTEWNSQGEHTILITGRSLESILDRRIVLQPSYYNIVDRANGPWENNYDNIKGSASINLIVKDTITRNCINNDLGYRKPENFDPTDPNADQRPPYYYYIQNLRYQVNESWKSKRNIDNLIYDSGDTTTYSEKWYNSCKPYNVHIENISVLDAVVNLCSSYQLGFKIEYKKDERTYVRPSNPTFGKYVLMCSLYDGEDKSDTIIFSPYTDSILDYSVTNYNSKSKNVFIFKCSNSKELGFDGYDDYKILTGTDLLWQDINYPNLYDKIPNPSTFFTKIRYFCRWWLSTFSDGRGNFVDNIPSGLDLKETFFERPIKDTYVGVTNNGYAKLDLNRDQIYANSRRDDVKSIIDYEKSTLDINARIDPYNTQYKLGVDYNLGDIVGIMIENGVVEKMRITSIIHVQDDSGYKVYPTFEKYVKNEIDRDAAYMPD